MIKLDIIYNRRIHPQIIKTSLYDGSKCLVSSCPDAVLSLRCMLNNVKAAFILIRVNLFWDVRTCIANQ